VKKLVRINISERRVQSLPPRLNADQICARPYLESHAVQGCPRFFGLIQFVPEILTKKILVSGPLRLQLTVE